MEVRFARKCDCTDSVYTYTYTYTNTRYLTLPSTQHLHTHLGRSSPQTNQPTKRNLQFTISSIPNQTKQQLYSGYHIRVPTVRRIQHSLHFITVTGYSSESR